MVKLVMHNSRMALVVREVEGKYDLVYLNDQPISGTAKYSPKTNVWEFEIPAQRALGIPVEDVTPLSGAAD